MPIRNDMPNRIRAKNERVQAVARKTIETLSQTHRAMNEAAIEADGYPSLIYIPLTTGRTCTCERHIDVLDEKGNLNPETMHRILQEADISFEEYGSDPKYGPDPTEGEEASVDDDTQLIDFKDFDPLTPDQQTIIDTEQPVGVRAIACALCMGYGRVGGYRAYRAHRLVLDATARPTDSGRVTVNTQKQPYRYDCNTNGYLEWTVTLPKGASRLDALRVWNNKDLIPSDKWALKIDGNVVTSDTLLAAITGAPQVVRIDFFDELQISHLELQLGLTTSLPKVDFSRIYQTTNNQVFKQVAENNVVIPPSVDGSLLKGSIVIESVHGEAWRMTDVNRNNDHAGNVLFYDCPARICQPYELAFLLPNPKTIKYSALRDHVSVTKPQRFL